MECNPREVEQELDEGGVSIPQPCTSSLHRAAETNRSLPSNLCLLAIACQVRIHPWRLSEVQGAQDWILRVTVHLVRVLGRDLWGRIRVRACSCVPEGRGRECAGCRPACRASSAQERYSGLHREGLRARCRSAALRRCRGPSSLPLLRGLLPPPPLPLRRRRPASRLESLRAAGLELAPTPIPARRRRAVAGAHIRVRSRTVRSPATSPGD